MLKCVTERESYVRKVFENYGSTELLGCRIRWDRGEGSCWLRCVGEDVCGKSDDRERATYGRFRGIMV